MNKKSDAVSEVKRRHDNSLASLKFTHVNKSIICIIMRNLSRSKAPKTQQICHYRHVRKTSQLFLLHDTGADFSCRCNFANLGSFAKVSVPVGSIIMEFPVQSGQLPTIESLNFFQTLIMNSCHFLL